MTDHNSYLNLYTNDRFQSIVYHPDPLYAGATYRREHHHVQIHLQDDFTWASALKVLRERRTCTKPQKKMVCNLMVKQGYEASKEQTDPRRYIWQLVNDYVTDPDFWKTLGETTRLVTGQLDLSSLAAERMNQYAEVILRQKAGELVDGELKDAFQQDLSEVRKSLTTIAEESQTTKRTADSIASQVANVGAAVDSEMRRVETELVTKMHSAAKEALAEASKQYRPIHIYKDKNNVKKLEDEIYPEEFEHILKLASQRINIMLVGPSGCGKTHVSKLLADALDMRFGSHSCSEGTSESHVAGWILPTGKGGQMEYRQSVFIDIYENGGVFLFDEMDAADPNMLTFVNAALANDRMFVPQRFENPEVLRSDDFICVAAANTFGFGGDEMYVGRNQLDAATLDRFGVSTIHMDYSDRVEYSLVSRDLLQWGRRIRQRIRDNRLERIMSTRTLITLEKMTKAYGWLEPDWNKAYFTNWTQEEKEKVVA